MYRYPCWTMCLPFVQGEVEPIQHPYRADSTAPPPGILTGNFYRYKLLLDLLSINCSSCSFSSGLVSSILFMSDIFIFKVQGLKFWMLLIKLEHLHNGIRFNVQLS